MSLTVKVGWGDDLGTVLVSPSCSALRLDSSGAHIHTVSKGRDGDPWRRVVHIGEPCQGHDVTAGNPQDGQLGQFLVIGVRGHCSTKTVERRTYCMHSRALASVRFHAPLSSHIFIVFTRPFKMRITVVVIIIVLVLVRIRAGLLSRLGRQSNR